MKMKYFLSFQFLAFLTILEISHALSCYDCSSKKDDTIETCVELPKQLTQSDPDICSTIAVDLRVSLEFHEKPMTLYIRKGEKRKSAGGMSSSWGESCETFSIDEILQFHHIVHELTKEEAKNGNVTIKSVEKCKCKSERCNRETVAKQKQQHQAEAAAHKTGTGGAITVSSSSALMAAMTLILSVLQLPRLFN